MSTVPLPSPVLLLSLPFPLLYIDKFREIEAATCFAPGFSQIGNVLFHRSNLPHCEAEQASWGGRVALDAM